MFYGNRRYRDEEMWDRLIGDVPYFLIIGLIVAGTIYLISHHFWGKSRLNEAAIARCIQRGNTDAECERRVEEHAALCYGLADDSHGRYSRGDFEVRVYDRCLKLGKDAYLEQVAKESRKKLREEQRMQEKYGLPP